MIGMTEIPLLFTRFAISLISKFKELINSTIEISVANEYILAFGLIIRQSIPRTTGSRIPKNSGFDTH